MNIPDQKTTYRGLFARDELQLKVKIYGDERLSNYDLIINQRRDGYFFEFIIINEWLKQKNRTVQIIEKYDIGGIYSTSYQFKKEPQPSYSQGALASRLENLAKKNRYNQRFWLDFQDEDGWDAIYIKQDAKLIGKLFVRKTCITYQEYRSITVSVSR